MILRFDRLFKRIFQFTAFNLVVLALGWTSACQSKSPEQTTLSDEKVAQIMADLSVANAATNGLSGNSKDSLMQVYFKQVFEIHNTSLEVYEKDLRIIAQDFSRMEKIAKVADDILKVGPEEGAGGAPKK